MAMPLMRMDWNDLLFAHWAFDKEVVRALVPPQLTLDTYDGKAWIGVVPFRMEDTRPLVPGGALAADATRSRSFCELNVRTYVTVNGMAGVWFFSLDAESAAAVFGARTLFKLPYFRARMGARTDADGTVEYESERTHRASRPASFAGAYRPVSKDPRVAAKGSLEEFLVERYALFTVRFGRAWRMDVLHPAWRLHDAEAEMREMRMLDPLGLNVDRQKPLLHY